MKNSQIISKINGGEFDSDIISKLAVGKNSLGKYKSRLISAINEFEALYGTDEDICAFSVSGRTEICGNHTDHNGGRVACAAVNLDILCIVSKRNDSTVNLKSLGFDMDTVNLDEAGEPDEKNYFTSRALIEGISVAFRKNGKKTGGFNAYTVSDIPPGSGLSSSAAFEVAVCEIFSSLYNDNSITPEEAAKYSQYAENVYFGKPCGLMDQMACASGGISFIDFKDDNNPQRITANLDLKEAGLSLCIVNTGANHADLNDDYAAVPAEMKAVAGFFGRKKLCGITKKNITENLTGLRQKAGDRGVLRALHFFDENDRVNALEKAVECKDCKAFLEIIQSSGNSSYKFLQNVCPTGSSGREVSLALYLTETFIKENAGNTGASRVHGGGFAGTIQAFIPSEKANDYSMYISEYFGEGCCKILDIRPAGPYRIF